MLSIRRARRRGLYAQVKAQKASPGFFTSEGGDPRRHRRDDDGRQPALVAEKGPLPFPAINVNAGDRQVDNKYG